jgi:hydrogenase expression/formation protein HypC
MCLAMPVRIEKLVGDKRAVVSQGNVTVEVDVSLLPNPKPGDHVIVHAGYAIETLTLSDAEARLALFRTLDELSGKPPA